MFPFRERGRVVHKGVKEGSFSELPGAGALNANDNLLAYIWENLWLDKCKFGLWLQGLMCLTGSTSFPFIVYLEFLLLLCVLGWTHPSGQLLFKSVSSLDFNMETIPLWSLLNLIPSDWPSFATGSV